MTMRALARAAALAVVALPAAARAQVGYPPTKSPYRDLVFHQELTAFTGYLSASKGRAGVAPSGGPVAGVRYEIRIGGPAEFTVRLLRGWTERTVLDPTKPQATRNLGTRAWPIYQGDVGITINLTGQKSWRRLVPVVNGGIGLVDYPDAYFGSTSSTVPPVLPARSSQGEWLHNRVLTIGASYLFFR